MIRITRESIYFTIFRLCAWFSVGILVITIGLLIANGYSVLSWQFLTAEWQNTDITKGGIFPAILGSIYLGLGVLLITFPLGLGTAIFITEYSRHSAWRRVLRLVIRNLAGVPSVVYGLFGLAFFVHFLHFGTSLLAAILTLSLMTLPWVISTSLEALESISDHYRETSLAVGATRWQTISRVVLPMALPGCLTGGVIGISRAMGEAVPIIIVGATFYLSSLPDSVLDKFMALPYHTFILATQHSSPHAMEYAAALALVLIALTFTLNLGAILTRYYYRNRRS